MVITSIFTRLGYYETLRQAQFTIPKLVLNVEKRSVVTELYQTIKMYEYCRWKKIAFNCNSSI